MTTAIQGIEPVRGWTPEWYAWGQFGGLAQSPRGSEPGPRPIHRKPTAAERMPVDVLLLRNNGEICG